MPRKNSQNQVVEYIYKELSSLECEELEQLLFEDEELQDQFFDQLHLKQELDEVSYTPSNQCLDNILNFSKSVNVESIS